MHSIYTSLQIWFLPLAVPDLQPQPGRDIGRHYKEAIIPKKSVIISNSYGNDNGEDDDDTALTVVIMIIINVLGEGL